VRVPSGGALPTFSLKVSSVRARVFFFCGGPASWRFGPSQRLAPGILEAFSAQRVRFFVNFPGSEACHLSLARSTPPEQTPLDMFFFFFYESHLVEKPQLSVVFLFCGLSTPAPFFQLFFSYPPVPLRMRTVFSIPFTRLQDVCIRLFVGSFNLDDVKARQVSF